MKTMKNWGNLTTTKNYLACQISSDVDNDDVTSEMSCTSVSALSCHLCSIMYFLPFLVLGSLNLGDLRPSPTFHHAEREKQMTRQ